MISKTTVGGYCEPLDAFLNTSETLVANFIVYLVLWNIPVPAGMVRLKHQVVNLRRDVWYISEEQLHKRSSSHYGNDANYATSFTLSRARLVILMKSQLSKTTEIKAFGHARRCRQSISIIQGYHFYGRLVIKEKMNKLIKSLHSNDEVTPDW